MPDASASASPRSGLDHLPLKITCIAITGIVTIDSAAPNSSW